MIDRKNRGDGPVLGIFRGDIYDTTQMSESRNENEKREERRETIRQDFLMDQSCI